MHAMDDILDKVTVPTASSGSFADFAKRRTICLVQLHWSRKSAAELGGTPADLMKEQPQLTRRYAESLTPRPSRARGPRRAGRRSEPDASLLPSCAATKRTCLTHSLLAPVLFLRLGACTTSVQVWTLCGVDIVIVGRLQVRALLDTKAPAAQPMSYTAHGSQGMHTSCSPGEGLFFPFPFAFPFSPFQAT